MTEGEIMSGGEFWCRVKTIAKRDWKTIPNLICYFRLLLIPVFLVLYIGEENYSAAAVVLLISGLSDVADGFIARRFNMVSDFGKVIDPTADKLTQLAVFISLSCRFKAALVLVALITLRELTLLIMGARVVKTTGIVNSAKWYGKLSTLVTETTALVLILMPGLTGWAAIPLLSLSCAVVVFSMLMYVRLSLMILKDNKNR